MEGYECTCPREEFFYTHDKDNSAISKALYHIFEEEKFKVAGKTPMNEEQIRQKIRIELGRFTVEYEVAFHTVCRSRDSLENLS
jgi:hypothetical protein